MDGRHRVHIGPLAVDPLTMYEAVSEIRSIALAEGHSARTIATAHAQFAQIAGSNPRFRHILDRAEIMVADGMSLVAASRLLGHPLPERIAGVDLAVETCREGAKSGLSVYFLGGRPCTAQDTAEKMRAWVPNLRVAGVDCPPMGFEREATKKSAVVERIRVAHPDILFVGFGAPKQEFWMEEHRTQLPVRVMVGVGGSFDVLSGRLPRAPLWMQHAGLEWLFRLILEPHRLWRRCRSRVPDCLSKVGEQRFSPSR